VCEFIYYYFKIDSLNLDLFFSSNQVSRIDPNNLKVVLSYMLLLLISSQNIHYQRTKNLKILLSVSFNLSNCALKMLKITLLISLISLSTQANIDVCNRLASIFDSDGNYLKKLCEIHRPLNHDRSESFCRQHGMELFVIENDVVFEGLGFYLNTSWIATGTPKKWEDGTGMRINGRRNKAGQWFTFGQKKLSLPPNLPWFVGAEYGDACMTIKRNGDFRISGYKCEKEYYAICELELVNENIYRIDDDIFNTVDVRSFS
jgi:hypothetical protein